MTPGMNVSEKQPVSATANAVDVALVAVGFIVLVLAAAALGFFGSRSGLGVVTGGVIAVLNLWAFKRIGKAFLDQSGSSRAFWGLFGAFKFVALLVGVGLMLRSGWVEPLSLLVGYGALPLGIFLGTMVVNRFEERS